VGKDYSGRMEIIWILQKEVRFGWYPKDSKVKCNQIRTVDKKRLINFVSTLLPEKLEMIEKALLIHLDIN
jgi:mRNA-degrading endonuclease toxin of MazEF toxin-antitoxin module